MLIIEMAKIELNGGHIGFNVINTYKDYQNEIGIMLIIEMAKIELTGGHIGFNVKILIKITKMKLELC